MSSFRGTGQAVVRATPAAQVNGAGAWFLDELTESNTTGADAGAAAKISEEERARLADEAYARGLADGEARARATALAQVRDALTAVRSAMAKLNELASLAPGVLEENVAALAVIVARQIVAREVTQDPELVPNLVRRALTEFPLDQSVRIRVNPVDLSVLTAAGAADQTAPIVGNRDASWLADPTIARGGCLVEGRDRIIDGRVDAALERIYRRMAAVDAS